MDVCFSDGPIVIHSDDDDDDDDDVVLVKTEEAPEDAKKRDEDDVIFVSEDPKPSLYLQGSKNRKTKAGSATGRSSGLENGATLGSLSQLACFSSNFASITLQPLDLSPIPIQTMEDIQATGDVTHNFLDGVQATGDVTTNLLDGAQSSNSAGSLPELGEKNQEKIIDVELSSMNVLPGFEVVADKNDCSNGNFSSRSSRADRFPALKLERSVDVLPSQTLNTPVCKIDAGKDCFNLCSKQLKETSLLVNNFLDMPSTSGQTFLDSRASYTSGQEGMTSLCRDTIRYDGPGGSVTLTSSADTNSLSQVDAASHLCGDNLTVGLPTAPSLLDTSAAVAVCGRAATPLSSNCVRTVLPCSTRYLPDVHSKPGTSLQFYDTSPPVLQAPDSASLCTSGLKTCSLDSGPSLSLLDFSTFSHDISNLFDFISSNGVGQTTSNSNNVGPTTSSANKLSQGPRVQLVNNLSEDRSHGAGTTSYSSSHQYISDCSSSSSSSSSSFSSEDSSLVKDSQDFLLNTDSPVSQLDHKNNVANECKVAAIDSGISAGATLVHPPTTGQELKSKTVVKHKLPDCIHEPLSTSSSSHSKSCLEVRVPPSGRSRSLFTKSKKSRLTTQPHGFKLGSNACTDDLLLSSGSSRDTSREKADPACWQIVPLDSQKAAQSKSHDSSPPDPCPEEKRRKLTSHLDSEKPSLKIRLKLSTVITESASNAKSSPQSHPSLVGLKKSIIRRHASMTDSVLDKMTHTATDLHRSVSECLSKKAKLEDTKEAGTCATCVTCLKAINSKKFSKCGQNHSVCAKCLEAQVKSILTGDVKQRNIRCPSKSCIEVLNFDELKRSLPSIVVDILEEKLDKEYLSYITKWMFTDEQLKTRSEFATSDNQTPPRPSLNIRKYEEIYSQETRDSAEDLPTFWSPMERGVPVMVFEVVPDTEEYRALAIQFHETLDFGSFDIVRIIRIQNPILWKYFALKRSEMVQENDGMDVSERQLYHGTHRSTLEAIARKGFDWRLSGKHGTVYGCGSYFARTSRYSHGYTDRAGSGISVKISTGPGRLLQPSLSLASLAATPFSSASSSYFSRLHSRFQLYLRTHQNPALPILPLPPIITSQHQPPQPPPAHCHLPAPPPAHGQMSSLQLPAHNQTSSPASSKNPVTASPAGPSSCASSSFNLGLGKGLPSSTSASILDTPTSAPKYPSCSRILTKTIQTPQYLRPMSASGLSHGQVSSNYSCALESALFGYRKTDPQSGLSPSLNTTSICQHSSNSNSIGHPHSSPSKGGSSNPSVSDGKSSSPSASCKTLIGEKGTIDLSRAFTREASSETHFMFLARVLVGRHTGGKAGLKRPPPLDENCPMGKSYDSCVDDIFCPQVYVIFDSNQAYPEYIIEYNWHKD